MFVCPSTVGRFFCNPETYKLIIQALTLCRGGILCRLAGGGGANLPPPLFSLNIHAMAMKIGRDMSYQLNFRYLPKKFSGNVPVGWFWCWRQQKWWFLDNFTSYFAWLTKKGQIFFLKRMILERVYKVPNELKKISRSIFFKFHDFSVTHCLAIFWSIVGIIVNLQR